MNANPLALVVVAQQYPNDNYYLAPKPYKNQTTSSRHTSSTSSHAPTRTKGKEVAKPRTPPSLSRSEDDSDPEQAQRDKDINKNVDSTLRTENDGQTRQFGNQRTITVDGARETVGNQVVQQTVIKCFNCKEYGHFTKECRKPKRVKDYSYHKEKMTLCKQEEKGMPLSAEQSDKLQDTNEEPDEQKWKHITYRQHSKQLETIKDTYVMETVDSNVIPDHSDMCNNEFDDDQNADYNDEDECVELANLIANLKLNIDEIKKFKSN
ncbi:retrovirus-related pol polyprotein from transposon TNT 1-94 [Tanacetum coccineum]